jgi:large subunit ribosomal protein L6
MSRIGLKTIKIPSGVTISNDGPLVTVKGPKGELNQEIARELAIEMDEGSLNVSRPNNQRRNRSQHGLARTLIANMVEGVTNGHKKSLEIVGVGYRAALEGRVLVLNMGYSHPVRIEAPEGIDFEVVQGEKNKAAQVVVKGIDKALVGQLAADIRKVRKPDPYKGKGLRYVGEVVKLRPGKRAGK